MQFQFRCLLMACFTLFSFQSFSQKNYLPGEIILNDGQLVKGLIDFREWTRNPNEIHFKTTGNDAPETYTPETIKQFKVKDEVYVSATIKNETGRNVLDGMSRDSVMYLHDETVFLQKLIDGTKSLYSYINHRGVESFYIKPNENFELLKFKKYVEVTEDSISIVHKQGFVIQLINYLDDCLLINDYINIKTDYDRRTLTKIFNSYYDCTKDKITYSKKADKAKIQFGILIGGSGTSLKFKSKALPDFDGAKFETSINPVIGVNLNIILSRNLNKWSINNDLLYTSFNTHGEYKNYVHQDYYSSSTFDFKASYIQLNNMLRYSFLMKSSSIFIEAGITNGLAFGDSNKKHAESTVFTNHTVTDGVALAETRKYEQGYLVGAGATYKKLMLELRHGRGNGQSSYTGLASSSRRNFILLGYRF